MTNSKSAALFTTLGLLLYGATDRAEAACTGIANVTQLQAITANPAGEYCLTRNIDASSVADFEPIPGFSGTFDGRGREIRNLTIRGVQGGIARVGLFREINGGSVDNVRLVNVTVVSEDSGFSVGALAGVVEGSIAEPGTINRVSVTGAVSCSFTGGCHVGGIAGQMTANTTMTNSWSSAAVGMVSDINVSNRTGGLVGTLAADASISRSFFTGRVRAQGTGSAGGLAGVAEGTISEAFAAGPTEAVNDANAGGLVGRLVGQVTQSFALGAVTGGGSSAIGGAVGRAEAASELTESYAAGRISGTGNFRARGLVAIAAGTVENSFWDTDTTGQATTDGGGTGLTTVQMQRALRPAFDRTVWGLTRDASYPFLAATSLRAPLSTLVHDDNVFVFLPIAQRDASQYRTAPAHAPEASKAAAFAMIARGIGTTKNIATLRNAKIDTPFWNDAAQVASFKGPVTQHATLGALTPINPPRPINNTNVIAQMDLGRLVLLRGTYRKTPAKTGTHWLLGTLYTRKSNQVLDKVVAHDPWTGLQVMIDPATKTVLPTAGFTLTDFKIDGYQPVTLK